MAEKEPVVVIKKITVQGPGHHGGSWKVAFADFMTALMAFFLVMWLVGQSEETKKNVADYFSTPSIIEYNFSNYGVELTLEKLFLDLINEPLKFFEQFIRPVDKTPNLMAMGSKKIVMHHIADQLGDVANNVQIYGNAVEFEIDANKLFFINKHDITINILTNQYRIDTNDKTLLFSAKYLETPSIDENKKVVTIIKPIPSNVLFFIINFNYIFLIYRILKILFLIIFPVVIGKLNE